MAETRIMFECQKCRRATPASKVDIGVGGAQWCTLCVGRVARALGVTRATVRVMESGISALAYGAAVEHMHRTEWPAETWDGRLRGLVFRWRELEPGAFPSYRIAQTRDEALDAYQKHIGFMASLRAT